MSGQAARRHTRTAQTRGDADGTDVLARCTWTMDDGADRVVVRIVEGRQRPAPSPTVPDTAQTAQAPSRPRKYFTGPQICT